VDSAWAMQLINGIVVK